MFLSQYLPNNAAKARSLSQVSNVGNYTSYSGFFTVDAQLGSNTFFWFFPSQDGNASAPLLLWYRRPPES